MFDELILSINSNIKAQETDSREICFRTSLKSNRTWGTNEAAGQHPSRCRPRVRSDLVSAGRASGTPAGVGAAGPALRDAAARVGGREYPTDASSKPRPTSKLGPRKGRAVHCVWVSVIFQGQIK